MFLGDILVGRGLVTAADVEAALTRQLTEGANPEQLGFRCCKAK